VLIGGARDRCGENIEDGLPKLTMPTLLLWARPGTIVNSQERVNWYQQRLPALDVVDLGQGIHYLQEDHPEEIGQAIVRWLERPRSRDGMRKYRPTVAFTDVAKTGPRCVTPIAVRLSIHN